MLKQIALLMFVAAAALGNMNVLQQQQDCDVSSWLQGGANEFVDFIDVLEIANVTSMVALAPIILEMRREYRAFQRADYPECLSEIRSDLMRSMDNYIAAFKEFMQDSGTQSSFDTAQEYLQEASDGLAALGIRLGDLMD